MFYPGQAVFVPSEKRLGIFLAYSLEKKWPYKPYMYVLTYLGDDGSESYAQVYEPSELEPIARVDKTSTTGQALYKTPFQKTSFTKMFSDEEARACNSQFINEMNKLLKSKWFKGNYTVDLTPK